MNVSKQSMSRVWVGDRLIVADRQLSRDEFDVAIYDKQTGTTISGRRATPPNVDGLRYWADTKLIPIAAVEVALKALQVGRQNRNRQI